MPLHDQPYNPGNIEELAKKIRHLPIVVATLRAKAEQARELTSDNFDVTVQDDPGTERPRAYVHPINSEGIREELSEGLLIKAAVAMEGR